MVKWHHQLNGHEFEQASGDSEGHAREAWHTALHGIINSGTQLSEQQHNKGSNSSQFWNFSNCLLIFLTSIHEAGWRLIEFCQENALVIPNTLFQQHKRRHYTWTSPDGQHRNQIDYIFAAKDGEALYSQQKQDRELTFAQIMNSLLSNSDLNWRK